jgi:hypothetical protein
LILIYLNYRECKSNTRELFNGGFSVKQCFFGLLCFVAKVAIVHKKI